MPAFSASDCRLYVLADDWVRIAHVETLGTLRPGTVAIVLRGTPDDLGQGILCAAAINRSPLTFRIIFSDGSERRCAARVVSARDRLARLRVVLELTDDATQVTRPLHTLEAAL